MREAKETKWERDENPHKICLHFVRETCKTCGLDYFQKSVWEMNLFLQFCGWVLTFLKKEKKKRKKLNKYMMSDAAILWFFFHPVLWKDIYSNSTTKEEKMCEKLLCCFMLPVGTIALAGISTWQNPLISPHKTTSSIPQGYYSNWVALISLYIVLLPFAITYHIFCTALHFSHSLSH